MARRVERKRAENQSGGTPSWLLPLLGGLLLGVVLGLIYAWNINPVVVANADPGDLSPAGQEMWVEMTADSYALNQDLELARVRLNDQFFSPEALSTLLGQRIAGADAVGDLARAQRLRQLAEALGVTPGAAPADGAAPAPAEGSLWGTLALYAGLALGLLLLIVVGAVLYTRMQQSPGTSRPRRTTGTRNRATVGPPPGARTATAEPPERTLPAPGEPDVLLEDEADELDRLFDDTAEAVEEATPEPIREIEFVEPAPAPARYSPALDEFVTRYNYGDDGFDMSFSIETPQTEFLGECGVGISDVLNNGSPQEVTAFEVWLFDKDDIRTVTKVLLSDFAWNNAEVRSRLSPKGELIHVKAGDTVDLETKSLRVRARVREVEYGDGGPGRHSYFERLVVELTPQQKM